MNDILATIVANKQEEVQAQKQIMPEQVIRAACEAYSRTPYSMKDALQESSTGIIAEFKRRSPSKGEIHALADVKKVVTGYRQNGAAACSILTDTRFFGGSLEDFAIARGSVDIPLLRKDFMVESYQIMQSYLMGADAVLIIAAMHTAQTMLELTTTAHRLGLQTIVEVHAEAEIEKIPADTDMVGVNNRNLNTFHTDVEASYKMIDKLPEQVVKIAESGIKSRADIDNLRKLGYSGFLIGETFMKEENPEYALRQFIEGGVDA